MCYSEIVSNGIYIMLFRDTFDRVLTLSTRYSYLFIVPIKRERNIFLGVV